MKVQGPQAPESNPRISVVVPTFRRPALLRRCLDALIAQRIDPTAFEIIVVDGGREDKVRDLVLGIAEWIRSPQVRYLRPLHGQGPGAARNRGWRAGRGAVIAFTDDDAVPEPGWLMSGARAFESNRHWVALSGRVVVPPPNSSRLPADHELMIQDAASAEFGAANAFVWRTALEAVGGFDERFTRAWCEDSDLQFKLLALGGAVGHCPDARVMQPVGAEPWSVCLRKQRNTYFDALLYKKHPRLYRQRIRRIPPWDYYLIVAFAAATPLLWAVDLDRLAEASVLVVVALVARLALLRLGRTDRSLRHLLEMLATSAVIPFLSVYWRLRGALRFRVLFL
ncbi:MAG TPA: glycosyltransferase [Burkholderiaceae bacterium]|nr:glycosyltransferase [Burkholderiaceae bacterium]